MASSSSSSSTASPCPSPQGLPPSTPPTPPSSPRRSSHHLSSHSSPLSPASPPPAHVAHLSASSHVNPPPPSPPPQPPPSAPTCHLPSASPSIPHPAARSSSTRPTPPLHISFSTPATTTRTPPRTSSCPQQSTSSTDSIDHLLHALSPHNPTSPATATLTPLGEPSLSRARHARPSCGAQPTPQSSYVSHAVTHVYPHDISQSTWTSLCDLPSDVQERILSYLPLVDMTTLHVALSHSHDRGSCYQNMIWYIARRRVKTLYKALCIKTDEANTYERYHDVTRFLHGTHREHVGLSNGCDDVGWCEDKDEHVVVYALDDEEMMNAVAVEVSAWTALTIAPSAQGSFARVSRLLGRCIGLQKLCLEGYDTCIYMISDTMMQLRSLRELHLSRSAICILPEDFGERLPELQCLGIAQTKICEVPASVLTTLERNCVRWLMNCEEMEGVKEEEKLCGLLVDRAEESLLSDEYLARVLQEHCEFVLFVFDVCGDGRPRQWF